MSTEIRKPKCAQGDISGSAATTATIFSSSDLSTGLLQHLEKQQEQGGMMALRSEISAGSLLGPVF